MSRAIKGPTRSKPVTATAEPPRGSLTVRLRSEVRKEIEAAAIRYGRSLSEEIETRLEVSLALKQYVRHEWGDDVFRIAQAVAGALSYIETTFGVEWTADDHATDVLQRTAAEIIGNYRAQHGRKAGAPVPQGSFDDKSPAELAKMFAALGGLPPPRKRRKIETGEAS